MGSWIGNTLIEVGGASACSGREAKGQESFVSCLSEVILKLAHGVAASLLHRASAFEPKVRHGDDLTHLHNEHVRKIPSAIFSSFHSLHSSSPSNLSDFLLPLNISMRKESSSFLRR